MEQWLPVGVMKEERSEERIGSVAWVVSVMFYLYTERGNRREGEKRGRKRRICRDRQRWREILERQMEGKTKYEYSYFCVVYKVLRIWV